MTALLGDLHLFFSSFLLLSIFSSLVFFCIIVSSHSTVLLVLPFCLLSSSSISHFLSPVPLWIVLLPCHIWNFSFRRSSSWWEAAKTIEQYKLQDVTLQAFFYFPMSQETKSFYLQITQYEGSQPNNCELLNYIGLWSCDCFIFFQFVWK